MLKLCVTSFVILALASCDRASNSQVSQPQRTAETSSAPESPSPVEGKLSRVELLEVARLSPDEARAFEPPAQDGLRFVILITPLNGLTGSFTLAETRSFTLGEVEYPLDEAPRSEPETNVYDWPEFRRTIRPDLATPVGATRADSAVALTIAIGGGPLPATAAGRVRIEVGWNKQTEEFWLPFTVPVRSQS
jgi:hypothetical protein